MKYSQKYLDKLKIKIPEVAFKLFVKKGIDYVSAQDLADATKLGVATIYRYYGTKVNLVIEVCTFKIHQFIDSLINKYHEIGGEKLTGLEKIGFLLDCFIESYKDKEPLLLFLSNFDLFIREKQPNIKDLDVCYAEVERFVQLFEDAYDTSKSDNTLKDIPNIRTFIFSVILGMFACTSKYLFFTMYPYKSKPFDYTPILRLQKEAILNSIANK